MRYLVVLLALLAFTSCDEEVGRTSGEGESCTRTDDCDSGLICVDLVCEEPEPEVNQKESCTKTSDCDSDYVCVGFFCVEEPRFPQCIPGVSQSCVCSDGYMSDQTCNLDGFFYTTCACPCSQGETIACPCPGALAGLQQCGSDGFYEVCICYEPDHRGIQDDGTWMDSATGLTWETKLSASVALSWAGASEHCAGEGAGWRLPTISEFRSLIRGCADTELGSDSCEVEEDGCLDVFCDDGDQCAGCSWKDGPGEGGCYWPEEMEGGCTSYWSSAMMAGSDLYAWSVNFLEASVNGVYIDNDGIGTRCVR